jgi:hypothetical protein
VWLSRKSAKKAGRAALDFAGSWLYGEAAPIFLRSKY